MTTCGDGIVQTTNSAGFMEQCDGGVNCALDCTVSVCGDGIIQGTEQCDDGNTGTNIAFGKTATQSSDSSG